MNPINTTPFTDPPQRQYTVYVAIIPNGDINNFIWNGFNIQPFLIGKELAYPVPHSDVLKDPTMLDDIYTKLKFRLSIIPLVRNSDLTKGTCGNPIILGAQTLKTCSVLWMHVHVIIPKLKETIEDIKTPVLDEYLAKKKFISPRY